MKFSFIELADILILSVSLIVHTVFKIIFT